MKRRRLLKMLGLLPFCGSLSAQGETKSPKKQPKELSPGQIWEDKDHIHHVGTEHLAFPVILLSYDRTFSVAGSAR